MDCKVMNDPTPGFSQHLPKGKPSLSGQECNLFNFPYVKHLICDYCSFLLSHVMKYFYEY